MNIAAALTRALVSAGVPVVGVSIGTIGDKSTWRIDYAPEATAPQIATGEALLLAFDATAPTIVQQEADEAAKVLDQRLVRALASATHKRFKLSVPADTVTAQQWLNAIRAEWDALG